jgi:anti-sigma28 factor (negative regulator of flagellin synthesis)
MDKIDALIKKLQEAKEELSKADVVKPDTGYGKITIKDNTPKSQKPADPQKPYGKVIIKAESAPAAPKPQAVSIGKHSNGKFKAYNWKAGQVAMHPEEFDTHDAAKAHYEAKGHMIKSEEELEKDAANPKLAPKEVKIKELQGKIDSGTYKIPAAKIADKMLGKSDKETEKEAMDAEFGKMAKDEAMMMGEGCGMEAMAMSKDGQWSFKKSAFKELESKLEHEGKSKESAGAIAYSVGEKKYGKAGMEAKAKAGEAKKGDMGDGEMC